MLIYNHSKGITDRPKAGKDNNMKASYSVIESRWGDWICNFYIDNRPDFDETGTNGTGLKFYSTEEKAVAAGKRYIKKMQHNGFDV